MKLSERQAIIVWLFSLKQAKNLRRFGNVHYVSRRLKYAVVYCNKDEVEATMRRLRTYSYVKKVEQSFRPFLKTEFENSLPDKAKEYDYKLGI